MILNPRDLASSVIRAFCGELFLRFTFDYHCVFQVVNWYNRNYSFEQEQPLYVCHPASFCSSSGIQDTKLSPYSVWLLSIPFFTMIIVPLAFLWNPIHPSILSFRATSNNKISHSSSILSFYWAFQLILFSAFFSMMVSNRGIYLRFRSQGGGFVKLSASLLRCISPRTLDRFWFLSLFQVSKTHCMREQIVSEMAILPVATFVIPAHLLLIPFWYFRFEAIWEVESFSLTSRDQPFLLASSTSWSHLAFPLSH